LQRDRLRPARLTSTASARARLRLALLVGCAVAACSRAPEPPARLDVAVEYDLATLDPHAEATLASSLLYNVYDPLVSIDAFLQPRPGLAQSWTNPDDTTWHLRLRPGVRFHSGRPLRAEDAAYSLERVLRTPALQAGYYLGDLESARALDEATLEVRTRHPAPLLLARLGFVPIVPEGSGERLATQADGTGAYALDSWRRGERLSLRRNDAYWGGAPYVQAATFALGVPPPEVAAGLLDGRFQLATLGSAPDARVAASERVSVLRTDSLFVTYLAFDLARDATPFCSARPNPFKDRRVRRAIHLALDRSALVAGHAAAAPAGQLVPRSVLGFTPELELPAPSRQQARRLLREAGLGAGVELTLHTRGQLAASAERVQRQLSEVGLRVQVAVLPDADYWRAAERSELSMWLARWGCTTVDAGELFENAMHSMDPAQRLGLFNRTGHEDAALDREIEASRLATDAVQRRDQLQALMRRVMEQLYWVPLFDEGEIYALDRRLRWRPRYSVRLAEIRPAGS
jgi:peptide/nickel transport system substrate-binding protein